jgi:hypothetical protein
MTGMKQIYLIYRRDSMLAIVFGIFLILHGIVHLLYAGQSWGLFELRPEMAWPAGSWLISKLLGNQASQVLATFSLVLAAIGFVSGSLGLFLQADWWRSVIAISAVFSSLIYIIFWNGRFQALDDQGGIGILINFAILILILVFNWPI